MGQYYKAVNLDKKEYIEPHSFGDGAKLMEFGCGGPGMMTGMAVLMSAGNGAGGGDLIGNEHTQKDVDAIAGRWAGDRIVIAGGYADGEHLPDGITAMWEDEDGKMVYGKMAYGDKAVGRNVQAATLYSYVDGNFEDISEIVVKGISADNHIRQGLGR